MYIVLIFQIGIITFYSLETQSVVGESKVSDEIKDLQICFDDSLDLLTLLVSEEIYFFLLDVEHIKIYLKQKNINVI